MAGVVQVGMDCVPASGGTTRVMRDFQRALDAPVISFTAGAPETVRGLDVLHVPVSTLPAADRYRWASASARADARRLIENAHTVVIHLLYRYHVQWAWREAERVGAKRWIVPHGALDPWVFTYRAWQKRAWLALGGADLLRSADEVVFATTRERHKAESRVGSLPSRVVPWPVAVPDEPTSAAARAEARSALGLPAGARVLLSLGRLHEMKRVLETVDAVRSVPEPDLRLLVVGPDETITADQVEARAGGDDRIRVLGPCYGAGKDLCYRAADGFVNLSHRENFGYAVAEALAYGLPVVLSPGNDLGPEIASADCGWLLETNAPSAAHDAIAAFAATPHDRLREMGHRARSWARERLSFDAFQRRLGRLVADVR